MKRLILLVPNQKPHGTTVTVTRIPYRYITFYTISIAMVRNANIKVLLVTHYCP